MKPIVQSKTGKLAAGLLGSVALAAVIAVPVMTQSAGAKEIVVKQPNGAPLSFADLIDQVSPAVVSVNVISEQAVDTARMEEFFERFRNMPGFEERFGLPQPDENVEPETRERRSLGSGFFISQDGYIVTNNHVVDKATDIEVVLEDGRELKATLVGADARTDLAVLKIDEPGTYRFVSFAPQAELRRGDWVVALGNPFGFGGTATAGIVSGDGRELIGGGAYTDFIQIDASINRGNSGGPTFDLNGQVVGVNTAIISPTGGSVGIGFAIPADLALKVTQELIKTGKVSRGWLGVSIGNFTDEMAAALGHDGETGAIVAEVVKDSPASKAGFRRNDVILGINGENMEDSREVTQTVGNLLAGSENRFEILRNGRKTTLDVKVEEQPANLDDLATTDTPGDTDEPSDEGATGEALGMSLRPLRESERQTLGLTNDEPGLYIAEVKRGGVADKEGLSAGQAILEVNFEPVGTVEAVRAAVESARAAGREKILLSVRVGRQTAAVPLDIPDVKADAE